MAEVLSRGGFGKMPRRQKISPALRRGWLKRHERGERQDAIASADKVNPRTVREQIERAGLELAFDAAQQEQLGEALRKHQEDMLDLLKRTKMGIDVPSLTTDLGFEETGSPDREFTLSLEGGEGHAVTVIIHGGQPVEIRLAEG